MLKAKPTKTGEAISIRRHRDDTLLRLRLLCPRRGGGGIKRYRDLSICLSVCPSLGYHRRGSISSRRHRGDNLLGLGNG